MTGPSAAVAAVRVAVRRTLPASGPVLVACSGGADSLALAAALAFEGPRAGLRTGLVTVDHQLQEGSAERASLLAAWAENHFDFVRVETVTVNPGAGPEAAARTARYEALERVAAETGASAVLLGHTQDDQAETVLLALARGSGPRGISGMPASRGVYTRPLLDLPRATVRQACADEGLDSWEDPHNTDDRYARARVRELIGTLGAKVVANLARTAALVAADCAELDRQAAEAYRPAETLDTARLAALAAPIRTRVIRTWALASGALPADLTHQHILAVDALVTNWRGQGPIPLPGNVSVTRRNGRLVASDT
ncbi:tRNA lysidine(34) synthetase TilS [Longispora albida]|uniref:tRNA lysidine(34) synthetase TilS n=1 Tax=Longispora albida TaxID=203523 RepID=UPI0003688F18|nr:tRNA lysidine(34) synthetase TilS [Longispora albida]